MHNTIVDELKEWRERVRAEADATINRIDRVIEDALAFQAKQRAAPQEAAKPQEPVKAADPCAEGYTWLTTRDTLAARDETWDGKAWREIRQELAGRKVAIDNAFRRPVCVVKPDAAEAQKPSVPPPVPAPAAEAQPSLQRRPATGETPTCAMWQWRGAADKTPRSDYGRTLLALLPEPFKAKDVMEACGCDYIKGNAFIQVWRKYGWIETPTEGQNRRTATFSAALHKDGRQQEQRPAAPPARPATPTGHPALSPEGVAMGLTLGEPFSKTDVQARLPEGQETKAYEWMAEWQRNGWIRNSGFMAYRRTEKFGK